jgi:hypothetical protein
MLMAIARGKFLDASSHPEAPGRSPKLAALA